MRQQGALCFWIAQAAIVLAAQPVRADIVEVRGVRLNQTPEGIAVILETTGGALSQVFTFSYNETFVADIITTQLRLPEGKTFRQDNPTEGIDSVTVTQQYANTIRVKVTGRAAVPQVQTVQSDRGFVFSLSAASNTTARQAPTPAPEKPAIESDTRVKPPATTTSSVPEKPAIEFDTQAKPPATAKPPKVEVDDYEDIELLMTGERPTLPQTSTPVYAIPQEEIQKQGSNSAAEVLRRLPGFAINDAGFGADIHTGTYYRGASINQSVFLLNGRPIDNNINTYHGATDLNSIPVESIERVELSSGTSPTL